MIVPATNAQVLVATKPVDFRRGADRLAALVQESLSADPFCGAIYIFRAKRANRVKVLWWDGSGICLLAKRLEEGQFQWPRIADGVMRLSAAQLSALLEGLDFSRVYPRDVVRPSATQ
jgi:transposase